MKKVMLVVIVCLMFWSCDFDDIYNITVTNNSALEITATFNNANEVVILSPGESKIVELWSLSGEADEYPHVTYSPEREIMVSYQKSKGTCEFYNREKYNIIVHNYTGSKWVLKETGGWMDEIVCINTSQSPIPTSSWVVYTDKPKFIATLQVDMNNFPASVLHILSGDTFMVTIGNAP